MGCVTSLLVLAAGLFIMLSLIRWFEQTTEAVEQGWWNKVALLVFMPFTVWFFPARVAAGRPTPVPRHEPVRGFGGTSGKAAPAVAPTAASTETARRPDPSTLPVSGAEPDDGPPPGTPAAFLVKPVVTNKPKRAAPALDPDKVARLRQKMWEQGMLDDEA